MDMGMVDLPAPLQPLMLTSILLNASQPLSQPKFLSLRANTVPVVQLAEEPGIKHLFTQLEQPVPKVLILRENTLVLSQNTQLTVMMKSPISGCLEQISEAADLTNK